jgi:hypothetical protein
LCRCADSPKQTAEEVIGASLNAVGQKADNNELQNLISFANCVSPGGKYTTEIHSTVTGYSYFKQVYSYKTDTFEAVIKNRTQGYIPGDSVKPLSKEAVFTIRAHEFQNIVLEVDSRFHDFRKPEIIETAGIKVHRLKAKDELNNECTLFFDVNTGLLTEIHLQSPDNPAEILEIKFGGWKMAGGFVLPHVVTIDQSGKKFLFEFSTIKLNNSDFKYKK